MFMFMLLDPCCGVTCPKFTKCAVNKDKKAVCVCQKIDDCPAEQDLVCGSDGKTYGNKCLMKATACKEKKAIEVANRKCGKLYLLLYTKYNYCSFLYLSSLYVISSQLRHHCPLSTS